MRTVDDVSKVEALCAPHQLAPAKVVDRPAPAGRPELNRAEPPPSCPQPAPRAPTPAPRRGRAGRARRRRGYRTGGGNDRLGSLRGVVRDGRASPTFLVPGSRIAVRVDGHAMRTADPKTSASPAEGNRVPYGVIVVSVRAACIRRAEAVMRFGLRSAESSDVPGSGALLREEKEGFDRSGSDATHAGSRMG